MKAYEKHEQREGTPVAHSFALKLLAGFAVNSVHELILMIGSGYRQILRATESGSQ